MPPYAVHCVACAANKSLLSVSRHWTGCSCHCRFFTLPASQASQQHWFTGEYRRYFLPQQTLSVPFLPSLSALSVPPVRSHNSFAESVSLCRGSKSWEKLPAHSSSLWFLFFLSQSFTLKYSSWVNGTMAALAVKDFYLSQLHALCVFPLLSSFFMFLQVNVMQARVPGEQMAFRKRKKVKV